MDFFIAFRGYASTGLLENQDFVRFSYAICVYFTSKAQITICSPRIEASTPTIKSTHWSEFFYCVFIFTPILNLHYKLLAKSKYNLDKDYTVCFDDIDIPTAKESAEIREINARTDSTYINAGVIAPEEVRQTLRENEKSGYSALEEEMPESEENPFEDIGGSEQSPFSEDVFTLDIWKEEEHPRNKNGEFSNGTNSETVNINKNFANDLQKVFINARFNLDNNVKAEIGNVSQKLTDEAKQNGYDITDYKHNVDASGIQHAIKHHGVGNEKEKNQIPIKYEDIEKIPDILYHYDKVTFGLKDKKGTDIIKYQKTMSDGEIFYLEEIRTGKKTLTLKTMYKKSR